jgi:hypothetical protein
VEQKKASLSAQIADKYKMAKGCNPGRYVHGNYSIDTSNCTEADAELFLQSGSTVLVKIVKEQPKAVTPAKK